MKFAYYIYPDRRAIVARYVGHFTLDELVASAQLLWSDPRYARSYDGLVDVSDSSVGVAMCDLQPLVKFFREHRDTSEGRWAAVTSSPLATACALIYQRALARRHTFEIFSTWAAACTFLNIDVSPDTPLSGGGEPAGAN